MISLEMIDFTTTTTRTGANHKLNYRSPTITSPHQYRDEIIYIYFFSLQPYPPLYQTNTKPNPNPNYAIPPPTVPTGLSTSASNPSTTLLLAGSLATFPAPT